jgi:hypothetical protein
VYELLAVMVAKAIYLYSRLAENTNVVQMEGMVEGVEMLLSWQILTNKVSTGRVLMSKHNLEAPEAVKKGTERMAKISFSVFLVAWL